MFINNVSIQKKYITDRTEQEYNFDSISYCIENIFNIKNRSQNAIPYILMIQSVSHLHLIRIKLLGNIYEIYISKKKTW